MHGGDGMDRGGCAFQFRRRSLLPRRAKQSGSPGAVPLGCWASGDGFETSAPQFGPIAWS
jgi:hypothetical protein